MQLGRSAAIDVLRATSVLYIVGFLHLLNYVPTTLDYANAVTYRIAIVVLGLFVFLSGYLLGSKSISATPTGLWSFYKKRLLRIWPLYALALILFVFLRLTSIKTALLASIGLAMVVHGPPPTLWFVAMLLLFYILAPALLLSARTFPLFVSITIGLSLLAQGFAVDPRLSIYFPAFALGIFTARNSDMIDRVHPYCIAVACVIAVFISCFAKSPETSSTSILIASLLPLFCWRTAERLAPNLKAPRLFGAISYAGYVMYLFHRPIYIATVSIFMPANPLSSAIALYIVGLPSVFAISYFIQLGYDRLLSGFDRIGYVGSRT